MSAEDNCIDALRNTVMKDGYLRDLMDEQLEFIRDSDLTYEDLLFYDACFKRNVSIDAMQNYLQEISWMNADQKQLISDAIYRGLSVNKINVFAGQEFSWRQMEQIYYGFLDGLKIYEVELYANPEYSYELMNELCNGLVRGLRGEALLKYVKHVLDLSGINPDEEPVFKD